MSESQIFTPELLNTFRASFSRTHYIAFSNSLDPPGLNFAPGQQMGTLGSIGVSDTGPPGTTPNDTNRRVFRISDDLFYVRKKHSFKVGTLINFYRQFMLTATNIRGGWSFSSLSTFLRGRASSFQVYTPGGHTDRSYDPELLNYPWQSFRGAGQNDGRASTVTEVPSRCHWLFSRAIYLAYSFSSLLK